MKENENMSGKAVFGLCCCMRAFSGCGEWGLLLSVVLALLIAVAFPVVEAQALVSGASVVGAHELSCPEACGISGPGIEPMSPSLAGRFLTTGPLGKSKKTTF